MSQRIELDGYSFDNDMGLEAQKEKKAIEYLTKQLDMNKPETVLKVYRQIISQKLFHTMVGYNFLKSLQNYLNANPNMKEETIETIEVDSVDETVAALNASRQKRGESALSSPSGIGEVKDFSKKKGTAATAEDGKYLIRSRIFMSTTIILLLCVIAMFAITLTAKSPNILNYRTLLNNQYELMVQELDEREQNIRDREQEMNNVDNDTGVEEDTQEEEVEEQ